MRYEHIRRGIFRARPNRFIAHVELEEGLEVCHVKNTGRCRELLVPGAAVYLNQGFGEKRKTRYDLVAVEKGGRLINMDAQAPNQVFREWAESGGFRPGLTVLRGEQKYGASRFDFYWEDGSRRGFVEVKGVTLEEDGVVRFPDAPTLRGLKHLEELRRARTEGYEAAVCFVVQMSDVKWFEPNRAAQPAFAQALREVSAGGVELLAMSCAVTPDSLTISAPVEIRL